MVRIWLWNQAEHEKMKSYLYQSFLFCEQKFKYVCPILGGANRTGSKNKKMTNYTRPKKGLRGRPLIIWGGGENRKKIGWPSPGKKIERHSPGKKNLRGTLQKKKKKKIERPRRGWLFWPAIQKESCKDNCTVETVSMFDIGDFDEFKGTFRGQNG